MLHPFLLLLNLILPECPLVGQDPYQLVLGAGLLGIGPGIGPGMILTIRIGITPVLPMLQLFRLFTSPLFPCPPHGPILILTLIQMIP